tara:strand:+ start:161 stop:448 length:288 start_codon:yes stop_codon:yes gene_type:complete
VFSDLFEGSRLSTVKPESELQNFSLSFIKRSKQLGDLVGKTRNRRCFFWIFSISVFYNVSKFCVTIFSEWFGQRKRLCCEAESFGDLVFGHVDFN